MARTAMGRSDGVFGRDRCLSWVVIWPAAAQETCYRIVDLGPLGFTPGIDDISGINNANQAVFTAVVNGKKHAMLYLPLPAYGLAAGMHDLHTLANLDLGVESASHDLNEAGIVVGQANNHAFVWRLDTDPFEFIDLGLFEDGTSSALFAINNDAPFPIMVGDGNLLGNCGCELGGDVLIRRAFALALEDPPDPLDDAALLVQDPSLPLPCQPNTFARDVKSLAGLIVAGYSNLAGAVGDEVCIAPVGCGVANAATAWIDPAAGTNEGDALAFLEPTHHEDNPGGSQSGGVSDTGAMVGSAYTAATSPCLQHAVYWDTDTADPPVDLGKATGIDTSAQSLAVRINNNQSPQTLQAVGWKFGTPDRAFLWECDGGCDLLANWSATNLNDAIQHCSNNWSIRRAYDVADNGWIIGVGKFAAQRHAILLTPLATCPLAQCLGDIDGNGIVGASDLLALLVSWGPCDPPPLPCDADLDCDGSVGASDLLILLTAWGPCDDPIASGPPQDVLDCVERFCCEEEDLPAFEHCICLIDPECDITP